MMVIIVTDSFKDTGIGIDPNVLPRLFTKFAKKSDTGTSLGLFISKKIVEAHGGKIWERITSVEKEPPLLSVYPDRLVILDKEENHILHKEQELLQNAKETWNRSSWIYRRNLV